MKRRSFMGLLGVILGWTFLPRIAVAVQSKVIAPTESKHEPVVWIVKSEDWLELTIGAIRVNVVRLRERNKDYKEGNNTYRWWKADEWMVKVDGSHQIISGNNIDWIKDEAERLLRDVIKFSKIINGE